MKKTALTILIERYDKMLDDIKHMDAPDTKEMVQVFKNEAISLLLTEREQMEKVARHAYAEGCSDEKNFTYVFDETDYLNEVFKQYTPQP